MDTRHDNLDNSRVSWPFTLRIYVLLSLGFYAVWEVAQLPLYTIWSSGSAQERWFAVAHCTLGDGIIASVALVMALAVVGKARWPKESFAHVGALTLAIGVAYTVYSEWLNVLVRKAWAYAPLMPTLPPLGTGLTPLLQWLVVPSLALWLAGRARP